MTTDKLDRIRKSLDILKLKEIAKVLDDELGRTIQESTPITEVLDRLFTLEADGLIQRRIERRIKQSKLPERKLLTYFDFSFQKGIDKALIMELAGLDFVERKQGLILAGNSGTGKYCQGPVAHWLPTNIQLSLYYSGRYAQGTSGQPCR